MCRRVPFLIGRGGTCLSHAVKSLVSLGVSKKYLYKCYAIIIMFDVGIRQISAGDHIKDVLDTHTTSQHLSE